MQTDTNHDLVIRVFSRFGNIICITVEFFFALEGVLLSSEEWFEHFGFGLNRKALCRRLSSRKRGLRHLKLATRHERKQSLRGCSLAGHREVNL